MTASGALLLSCQTRMKVAVEHADVERRGVTERAAAEADTRAERELDRHVIGDRARPSGARGAQCALRERIRARREAHVETQRVRVRERGGEGEGEAGEKASGEGAHARRIRWLGAESFCCRCKRARASDSDISRTDSSSETQIPMKTLRKSTLKLAERRDQDAAATSDLMGGDVGHPASGLIASGAQGRRHPAQVGDFGGTEQIRVPTENSDSSITKTMWAIFWTCPRCP